MEVLIKITENNGVKAVSARELHKYLEVKNHFTQWIKDNINQFDENIDYQAVKVYVNASNGIGGTNKIDYALTLDCAKEMAMLSRVPKGKQARKYFIECEKRSLNPYQNISRLDALRLAVEAEEKAEKFKALAVKNQVRSDYLDKIMASDDIMDIGQAAKILAIPKLGRNNLFKELRDRGYFFKNRNEPKQQYISQGLFQLKEKYVPLPNGEEKLTMKVLVTQKGLAFIAKWFDVIPPSNNNLSIQ